MKDLELIPLSQPTKKIVNDILSIPVEDRNSVVLLSDKLLVASGLTQPFVEDTSKSL